MATTVACSVQRTRREEASSPGDDSFALTENRKIREPMHWDNWNSDNSNSIQCNNLEPIQQRQSRSNPEQEPLTKAAATTTIQSKAAPKTTIQSKAAATTTIQSRTRTWSLFPCFLHFLLPPTCVLLTAAYSALTW